MEKSMNSRRILVPLVAAMVLAACDNDSGIGGVDGESRLTIRLTDAPGDLEEAWVRISKVVLIGGDGDDGGPGRLEFVPLETDYINLLDLAHGAVMELVDEAAVPGGTYQELRFVLDEAFVVLKDGRVYATSGATLPAGVEADGELNCPSCGQSGFKAKFQSSGGLTIEDNTIVTVDFDAAKSFGHQAGNSGMWIMHPVLRATAATIRLGAIYGRVELAEGVMIPACGGQENGLEVFRPRAVTDSDTLFAVTDTTGYYRFGALLPDVYELDHVASLTFTNGDSLTIAASPSEASVTLAQGDSAEVDYQITAAACH